MSFLVAVPLAQADPTPQPAGPTGGAEFGAEPPPPFQPVVPGDRAVLKGRIAYAPANAPLPVQQAIWAANEIQDKPYRYGGGHARIRDRGYDCSGTVSFALNGAGLLKRPRDSSSFMRYGAAGKGRWITIYTNPGHAYAVIAGLRLDTSIGSGRSSRRARSARRAHGSAIFEKGPRWRPWTRSSRGFKVRHPVGL